LVVSSLSSHESNLGERGPRRRPSRVDSLERQRARIGGFRFESRRVRTSRSGRQPLGRFGLRTQAVLQEARRVMHTWQFATDQRPLDRTRRLGSAQPPRAWRRVRHRSRPGSAYPGPGVPQIHRRAPRSGTVLNAPTIRASGTRCASCSAPEEVWAITRPVSSSFIGREQLTMTLPDRSPALLRTSSIRDQRTASRITSAPFAASRGVPARAL